MVLAVTVFVATNSVFNIIVENNSFSITTPGYWSSEGGSDTINKPQSLLELTSQVHIEFHIEEFEKRIWYYWKNFF